MAVLKLAARQGPALGVTPVLMPSQPNLWSNLLVLSQVTSLYSVSLWVILPKNLIKYKSQWYFLVPTIYLNSSFFIAAQANFARLSLLDLLNLFINPCGLEKLVYFSSISWPTLFISATKVFIPLKLRWISYCLLILFLP